MNGVDIRVALLDLSTRKRIKELSISIGDIDILNCVASGIDTSGEIAKCLDVKVNSISTRLKTLRAKGYLTREEVKSVTGGIEYKYKNIYSINK